MITAVAVCACGVVIGYNAGVRRQKGESWQAIIEAGFKWCFDVVVSLFKMLKNAIDSVFRRRNVPPSEETIDVESSSC